MTTRHSFALVAALCLAAGPAGCELVEYEEAIDETVAEINGGSATTRDGFVLIEAPAPVPGEGGLAVCSGVLMTNTRWVLTAKRCVHGMARAGLTLRMNGQVRGAEKVVELPSADIALIKTNWVFYGNGIPLYRGSIGAFLGLYLPCYGYGAYYGTTWAGTLRVAYLYPTLVYAGFGTGAVFSPGANGSQKIGYGDGGGACLYTPGFGDAGGGTAHVAGVIGRNSAGTPFGLAPILYASWVDATIASM